MPERVGRYEIRERIGQGAMAEVFRAFDPEIGRDLAVKVLKGEFRENAQYAARFLREAKAAGALSHPNIVTIYDVGQDGGYPYIAMELLEGEPLDAVLERYGRLPADDVLSIGLQLVDALSYAHGLGVVHRDIKPSNIVLAPDGRGVKILDFGIARVAEAHVDEAETLRTQAGQVLGTPRYMSPEQALGQEIDGRSDLFSTGTVLYELLTGRRAFDGSSAATLALQITQQDPPPIADFAPDAPRGLQFIIGKLMAKRPDRRFADGAQAAEAFRREQGALAAARGEARATKRRLPLQVRLSVLMAVITGAVLLAGSTLVVQRQYQAMEQMALTSGTAVAAFVASNVALQAADNASLPPAERDWLPVEAFVKSAVADPNIKRLS
ncbi:MAG: serine/threonine-protein kinase, partial [Bacilli bacterium]